MTRRAADERGFILVAAIVVLAAMMALGLGMVAWVDAQQTESRQERTRESSFNQAEALVNAQVLQLGQAWPSAYDSVKTPAQCTSTSGSTTFCPQQGSITGTYAGTDYTGGSCGGQTTWTTKVQDDVAGATQYYNGAVLNGATPAPSWDANGNGTVWIRATANAQCHKQTIVSLVSRVLAPLNFPRNVLTGNWFKTGNAGAKVIVDTLGAHAHQRADLVVRCAGSPTALSASQCAGYQPGQVAPDSTRTNAPVSASSLDATQVQNLRQQASYAGTYYASGTCPSAGALTSATTGIWSGAPVFVEGPCTLTLAGTSNSDAQPGSLVVVSGTVAIGANSRFYGLIYALNQAATGFTPLVGPPAAVVSLSGCGIVQGAIVVDGLGGVDVGACKGDLVYDPRVFDELRTFAGAGIVKNAWRVLPG